MPNFMCARELYILHSPKMPLKRDSGNSQSHFHLLSPLNVFVVYQILRILPGYKGWKSVHVLTAKPAVLSVYSEEIRVSLPTSLAHD